MHDYILTNQKHGWGKLSVQVMEEPGTILLVLEKTGPKHNTVVPLGKCKAVLACVMRLQENTYLPTPPCAFFPVSSLTQFKEGFEVVDSYTWQMI